MDINSSLASRLYMKAFHIINHVEHRKVNEYAVGMIEMHECFKIVKLIADQMSVWIHVQGLIDTRPDNPNDEIISLFRQCGYFENVPVGFIPKVKR